MKVSIHQAAAFAWLLAGAALLAPVAHASTEPTLGLALGQGIVSLTCIIAAMPLLLRLSHFRDLFCWTDALSANELGLLAELNWQRYYQVAFEHGYPARVLPYLKRIVVAALGLLLGQFIVPEQIGPIDLWVILIFASLYPMAVLMLILATYPIWQVIRAKVKG